MSLLVQIRQNWLPFTECRCVPVHTFEYSTLHTAELLQPPVRISNRLLIL